MTLYTALLYAVLFARGVISASSDLVERTHARDLQKRAEVDCGTWVMQCAGTGGGSGVAIEDICNNACFFQKYLYNGDGQYVGTYRTDGDNDHNRIHSGCQAGGKSVCKAMPFSQKLADGFNLESPTCEEFPMADWAQDDFKSGQARNALRCVEARQNTAAGGQWESFQQGNGDQPKRKCQGPMNQVGTDYKFTIEMNLDGARQDLLGYCLATPPNGPDNIDPGEFFMQSLSLPNGAINFPLKESDNVYDTAAKWGDTYRNDVVWQCRLELERTVGDNYNVDYYGVNDGQDNQQLLVHKEQGLHNDGDRMVLDASDWKQYPNLIVIRTGEFGKGNTPGSRVDFISSHTDDGSNPLTDFSFTTESQGWGDQFKPVDGSDKGYYCDVPNIDDSGESGPRQHITCWFPCNTL